MTQSTYSFVQELNDIASSVGAALLARVGSNPSDHVFRTCAFLLAKEVAAQRRKAFEWISDDQRFAHIPGELFDQQHRQWVISLLFGTVIHPEFQPDVVAEYEHVARSVVAKTEQMINHCPELFG
jgi:hypothetical protein